MSAIGEMADISQQPVWPREPNTGRSRSQEWQPQRSELYISPAAASPLKCAVAQHVSFSGSQLRSRTRRQCTEFFKGPQIQGYHAAKLDVADLREEFIRAYAERPRIEQAADDPGSQDLLTTRIIPLLAGLRERAKRELSAAEYRNAVAVAFERVGRHAEAAFILAD